MTLKQEAEARRRKANARHQKAQNAFKHAELAYVDAASIFREYPDVQERARLDEYHALFRRMVQDAEREVERE